MWGLGERALSKPEISACGGRSFSFDSRPDGAERKQPAEEEQPLLCRGGATSGEQLDWEPLAKFHVLPAESPERGAPAREPGGRSSSGSGDSPGSLSSPLAPRSSQPRCGRHAEDSGKKWC